MAISAVFGRPILSALPQITANVTMAMQTTIKNSTVKFLFVVIAKSTIHYMLILAY